MTLEEQTTLLENKILEKKDIFLCSNEKNVFCNYSDLMTLEYDYRKITGSKKIIDDNFLNKFYLYRKDLVDGPMDSACIMQKIIRNQIIDKNIKQLVGVATHDILRPMISTISSNDLKNIKKIEKSFDNTNLDYNDVDNIINDFLKINNYKYRNLYNKLKEQGRIFLVDGCDHLGSCYSDIDPNSDYSYIIINKNQSIISICLSIAHELGHIIEILELKDNNISNDDLYKFTVYNVFDEVISTSYNKKCLDYIENMGIDEDIIKKYRLKDLFNGNIGFVNDIVGGKRNLYSIERTYACIINNYFDSIILPNKRNKLEKVFNEEKLLNDDINILYKLNCDNEKIRKSTVKSLRKIL